MKILWNDKKSKRKRKKIDKIKSLEILLVKLKYATNPNKLQNTLKDLNKIQFVDKNLHEIKNEILGDYAGEFEMVGSLVFVDQIWQTHIRFRILSDFESSVNSIDQDYESDDAFFDAYIYKIITPQFNLVNRSQYGNGCDFEHEDFEYQGNNCFKPKKCYFLSNVLIS